MYRASAGHNFQISSRKNTRETDSIRFRIAKGTLAAFAMLLIVRLFTLQIVDAQIYRSLASEQREIYRELFPERGEILIRDGKSDTLTPIATNKDLYLVYADPRLVENPKKVAETLAPLLGIEKKSECKTKSEECNEDSKRDGYQELFERLAKSNDPYEPLKRGVEETLVKEISSKEITGIEAVREPVRYYPLKNIGAHLVGFLGSDGEKIAGRYGIEGAFEQELAGTPGFFEGEKDLGGRWIPVGQRKLEPAIDGATVVLTIDRAIQYFACNALNEAVSRHGASGGSVLIGEVRTGAILAMCGAPDFDPNEYNKVEDISIYNNPATFIQYEPGSVFKVITMAAALDTQEVTPETTYEDKGEIKIGPFTINNSDYKAHGIQTMTQVLEQSLNTGAMFAAKKVGTERFLDYVERFGFGKKTGIELENEAKGDIESLKKRGEIYLATSSFGQGISVSPIQLLSAIGAIANQGKLTKPHLVSEIRESNGATITKSAEEVREVISARTATLLSGMMVSVVEKGHGKRAGVKGYYVAGKTGTAQIPRSDGKGYEPGATIGTFVGFAPVDNPKFVMVTRIDRPKDVKFAESTAAPLFGEIAKFLLQYFEIKPTRSIK